MHLLALLQHFAYPTLFIGTFLEGESVILLAAYLAAHGRLGLDVVTVGVVSFLGAYAGHVVFFWLGRSQGPRVLRRFPHWEYHADKARAFFRRYGTLGIFLSQYIYGFRIAFAILIGISEMRVRTFLLLEALSCAIWAALFTVLGALFGRAVYGFLDRSHWLEWVILALFILLFVAITLYHVREDRVARELHRRRSLAPGGDDAHHST